MLHVPNGANARPGHGANVDTAPEADRLGPGPAVVPSDETSSRKYVVFPPPMVASNSLFAPAPLNQSRALPKPGRPPAAHVARMDAVTLSVEPGLTATGPNRLSGIEARVAFGKPPGVSSTPSSRPPPTGTPSTEMPTFRSTTMLPATAGRPTHRFAGLSAVRLPPLAVRTVRLTGVASPVAAPPSVESGAGLPPPAPAS